MKRILYAIFMAVIVFTLFNFFYSNMGSEAFNYPVRFRFTFPHLFSLVSFPVSTGFLLISAFSAGMIFLPLLQVIPSLFRSAELRAKEKRIKELERELELTKSSTPDQGSVASF